MKQIAKEWWRIDWRPIYERTGLAPTQVPGVRCAPGSVWAEVHLTHLRQLGLAVPSISLPGTRALEDAGYLFRDKLRPHQVDGLRYIRSRRGTLLADEMRVGKTATTMYSHDSNDGTMFIIGPLAARAVWHEWAARRFGWCGDVVCSICRRVRSDLVGATALKDAPVSFVALESRSPTEAQVTAAQSAKVVFCHFAIMPAWRFLFEHLRIGTLVVDEIHLPQSGMQSRKSETGGAIRFMNTVAKRAVFLSGSPLWNKPKGLWHILDMLNPGAWGDYWTFCKRYADAKPGAYGWRAEGSSHEEELRTRLQETMLRRTWKDIASNLPPIQRGVEIVPLSDATRDRVEESAARLRAGTASTVVGDLARLRKMYAKEKANAAMIKAREAMQDGHSVIVWTWHREVAAELATTIASVSDASTVHIDGDTPPSERERIIEHARTMAASRPVCLVATMGALATAVNLSFADVEIFAELDWNPDSIAQAEMRPYDGTRPIASVFLVADCEVEQKLMDALLSKFEVKDKLGVAPGVGSVADVLQASIGVESARSLDALAAAVMAEVCE
jgi:hypothetical protein